jgi:hypothetical protein
LRAHQEIHGTSGAGSVGRVLRDLAMEPQVGDIHRKSDGGQKKKTEGQHDEYHCLAALIKPRVTLLAPQTSALHGKVCLNRYPVQFTIRPEAAARTVKFVHPKEKNDR